MKFSITSWSAFGPGLSTQEEWISWSQTEMLDFPSEMTSPDVKFLPMMMRRRLGLLAKMSFWALHQIEVTSPLSLVFSSRHGDSSATNEILEKLSQTAEISPAEFSLSVHNSSPGLYAIHTKNTEPYTAIAAGPCSFQMGLIESVSMSLKRQAPVLYLYVENDLNPKFQKYIQATYPPHAMCFLIDTQSSPNLHLELNSTELGDQANNIPSLHFLKWFLNTQTPEIQLEKATLQKC